MNCMWGSADDNLLVLLHNLQIISLMKFIESNWMSSDFVYSQMISNCSPLTPCRICQPHSCYLLGNTFHSLFRVVSIFPTPPSVCGRRRLLSTPVNWSPTVRAVVSPSRIRPSTTLVIFHVKLSSVQRAVNWSLFWDFKVIPFWALLSVHFTFTWLLLSYANFTCSMLRLPALKVAM